MEVNSTFYKLPQVKTANRWRRLANEVHDQFEFTVKCLQTVTHKDRFESAESVEAFNQTKEIAQALQAKIILLQSPPSFGPTEENLKKMDRFFEKIDPPGFTLAWEPRGDWPSNLRETRQVCEEFGLIHCTDPFKQLPVGNGKIAYLRLHGKPPGDQMYKYEYKEEDLKSLKEKVDQLDSPEVYALFNDYSMYFNAKQLERALQ